MTAENPSSVNNEDFTNMGYVLFVLAFIVALVDENPTAMVIVMAIGAATLIIQSSVEKLTNAYSKKT